MNLARLRVLLFSAALACIASHVSAQSSSKQMAGARAPENEPEVIFTGSVLKDVARRMVIAPDAPDASLKRNNLTSDRSGRFEAFTVEDPKHRHGFLDRIFFTDARAKKAFEIQNLPDPHRPFDSLKFIGDGILQFDRWAGPHTGTRYKLNVRSKKLLSARAFIEADYVELQKRTKSRRKRTRLL